MDKPLPSGAAYVAAQFVLIPVILALPGRAWFGGAGFWGPPWQGWEVWPALGLSLAGVALAAWAVRSLGRSLSALPKPKRDAHLVTEGAYRWLRHPIYSALLLIFLAYALVWKDPATLAAVASLGALFTAKSRLEERWLLRRYPGYAAYRRRSGGLLPRLGFGESPARPVPEPEA